MLSKIRSHKGFTLIELMIVVAIIGILAAIAIPNFMRFQLKARASEGRTNVGALRALNESFRGEWNNYALTVSQPRASGALDADRFAWPVPIPQGGPGAGGFDLIGFQPAGAVYFCYGYVPAGGVALVPAAAGAAPNLLCDSAGGVDTLIIADPLGTGRAVLSDGTFQVATGATPDVNYIGTADLDFDTALGSFVTNDELVDIIRDPVDFTASIF